MEPNFLTSSGREHFSPEYRIAILMGEVNPLRERPQHSANHHATTNMMLRMVDRVAMLMEKHGPHVEDYIRTTWNGYETLGSLLSYAECWFLAYKASGPEGVREWLKLRKQTLENIAA